jgi:hypothetical protein
MKALGSIVAGVMLVGIWYMPRSGSVNVFAQSNQSKLPEATIAEVSKPAASNPAKTSSKRLKIEVEVSSPSEILVEEGQKVTAKQVIVDRKTERTSLTNQLQETKLSIERLKTSPKVSKVPPASVSTLKNLPKAQYLEESAQVNAATAKLRDTERKYAVAKQVAEAPLPETGKVRVSNVAVRQAEEAIRKQQQKIDALSTIQELDPAVKQHEEAKLTKLRQTLTELQAKLEPDQQSEAAAKVTKASNLEAARFELTTAQRDLELAKARLGAASEKRQQTEYEYQIKQTERTEQVQRLELERVKLLESGKLQEHDREYQIAQLVLKHNQIQRQLEELAVVKTPHAGTIRRVKLAGQRNGLLQYEVVLVYSLNGGDSKTNDWKEE